jgi:hypothetical protein
MKYTMRQIVTAAVAASLTAVALIGLHGCWLDEEANIAKVQPLAQVADAAAATGVGGPYGLAASLGLNGLLALMTWLQKRKTGQVQADVAMVKTAFGVVSRALDTSCSGEAGGLVAKEIADTPGATTDLLKRLHTAARDREL